MCYVPRNIVPTFLCKLCIQFKRRLNTVFFGFICHKPRRYGCLVSFPLEQRRQCVVSDLRVRQRRRYLSTPAIYNLLFNNKTSLYVLLYCA